MDNKNERTEYFLGPGYLGGFEIIEHNPDRERNHRGGVCFSVNEYAISDGDGFPAAYDDSYVQIDEKDYRYVIDLFRKAGEAMCVLGDKAGKPLDRPIAEGDYLYDGTDYVHIDSITTYGKYLGENFYYNYYDAAIDMDTDDLDDVFDTDDSDNEFLLIYENVYRDALNIIRSAIIEITDYLDRLYKYKTTQN